MPGPFDFDADQSPSAPKHPTANQPAPMSGAKLFLIIVAGGLTVAALVTVALVALSVANDALRKQLLAEGEEVKRLGNLCGDHLDGRIDGVQLRREAVAIARSAKSDWVKAEASELVHRMDAPKGLSRPEAQVTLDRCVSWMKARQ